MFVKNTQLNGLKALPLEISNTPEWEFDYGGFEEEVVIKDVEQAVKDQAPSSSKAHRATSLDQES